MILGRCDDFADFWYLPGFRILLWGWYNIGWWDSGVGICGWVV